MKKRSIFLLSIITFLMLVTNVKARKLNLQELIERIDTSNVDTIYIIGTHAFTSNHKLSTQDVMVASRTIENIENERDHNYTDYKNDAIYQALTMYKITINFNPSNVDEVIGATIDKNIFGSSKLDLDYKDSSKKYEINYIDYQFVPLETEATVALTNDKILDKSFDGNDSSLQLNNNELSGLIKYNSNVNIPDDKKTNYYFAYEVTVPKATDETIIKVTNKNGKEITYKHSEWSNSGENKHVILAALESSDKEYKITIDQDGDGYNYSPLVYTIKLGSNLRFQTFSTASITTSVPEDAKSSLENLGYYLPSKLLDIDNSDPINIKLSGLLAEQNLKDDVYQSEPKLKTGYYVAITIDLGPNKTDKATLKVPKGEDNVLTKVEKDFNSDGTYTFLYSLNKDALTKTFDIEVDLDGDDENYLPQKITIDYTKVLYAKLTKANIVGYSEIEDKTNVNKLFSWENDNIYKVTIEAQKDQTFIAKGVLPRFIKNNEAYGKYYLIFSINTLEEPKDGVKVTMPDNSTYQKASFTDNALVIIKEIKENDPKSFVVKIDLDGDGTDYVENEYTIDYSNVTLQKDSVGSKLQIINDENVIPTAAKTDFSGYNYKLNTLTYQYNQCNGIIKEQTIKGEDGYYVAVSINYPSSYPDFKNSWKVRIYTDDNFTELADVNYDYENGYAVALVKLTRDSKSIKYEIDFDGTGNEFAPKTEEIKFNNVSYKSADKITYVYYDATGNKVNDEHIVYEGDQIPSITIPTDPKISSDSELSFRHFDKWLAPVGTTAQKDQDVEVKAHYVIDADNFIKEVVNKLNTNSTLKDKVTVSKAGDTITFKVSDIDITLNDMNDTDIPGAIAYILNKGEIKEITLDFDTKSAPFTNANEGTALLKEKIKDEAKNLFEEVLNEDKTLQYMALNDKTYTLTIGSLDDTVLLKGNTTKYNFVFETDTAVIDNEEDLDLALNNYKIKNIIINSDIDITREHEVSRIVSITSKDNKTLKATSPIDSIFKITAQNLRDGNAVNISKLKLAGTTKASILVTGGSFVNVTDTEFAQTGTDYETAGIEVQLNAKVSGSNLTYSNEKYAMPLVKATKKSGTNVATVDITDGKGAKLTANNVYEIKPYSEDGSTNSKNEIGETKVEKSSYNYNHYYLNSDVANRWYKLSFVGDRALTRFPVIYTIYYDREYSYDKVPEPKNIRYLTTYENANLKYDLKSWETGGTPYESGNLLKPTADTSYYAILNATYKAHVLEVGDEETLKKVVAKTPDADYQQYTTIIITKEINLSNELDIARSNIIITGTKSNSNNVVGTLKGKIKVSGEKVSLVNLNITGVSEGENNHLITVSGIDFNSDHVTYRTETGKWDSYLYYTVKDADTYLFYNRFYGNDTVSFIEFAEEIDGNMLKDGNQIGSSFVGNEFYDENDDVIIFNLNKIKDNTTLNLRQTTLNLSNENSYLIKMKAQGVNNPATISIVDIWNSKSTMKKIKFLIDITENNDATGIKVEKTALVDAINDSNVYYLNGVDTTNSHTNPIKIVTK